MNKCKYIVCLYLKNGVKEDYGWISFPLRELTPEARPFQINFVQVKSNDEKQVFYPWHVIEKATFEEIPVGILRREINASI